MTKQSEIIGDVNYLPVLDHGFVGIVDTMGSDSAVVQAARVSYGAGTKAINNDRGLIRYLISHKHTSPLEMNEVKLHIKLPIFVMRQLVRHRTSSLNEMSGRYSVMTDEFYVPELAHIKPQSVDNKQGRAGDITEANATNVRDMIERHTKESYSVYETLLGVRDSNILEAEADGDFVPRDDGFDEDFNGIARELARTVLPVNNYTELYWKQNLHNLFHLLKLRMDAHAQYEIRALADAIYELVKPRFPICCEAFEDYIQSARNLSRMDLSLLLQIIDSQKLEYMLAQAGSEEALAAKFGMNKRELAAFRSMLGI